MRGPELAIIVTTYQMPRHLRLTLESIAVQRTSRTFEVLVCDDGSADETPAVVAAFAARMPFPVRFLTHPHTEFQAARCRNEGVRHSTAPHLLFIDGDCLLPPDHIEQHLRHWQPGSVNTSYCVRFGPGASEHVELETVREGQFTTWATPYELKKLRRMHYKSLLYRLIRHPTKPAFRSGNFLLARADYLRVNGFDEQFRGWGCEDDDLGQRFRAAGIRLRSVLHRTRVYHLWHPPAPSRPQQWKLGGNVAYLHRPIRLTRCLQGCVPRQTSDLSARLVGRPGEAVAAERWMASLGCRVTTDPQERVDLEVLCRPGRGRFSGRADCRVLLVGDAADRALDTRAAHVVMSPSGHAGGPEQARLRLNDIGGLWATVNGGSILTQRAAA